MLAKGTTVISEEGLNVFAPSERAAVLSEKKIHQVKAWSPAACPQNGRFLLSGQADCCLFKNNRLLLISCPFSLKKSKLYSQ